MIIKTLLKHIILEKCINVLFEGIENSFTQIDYDKTKIQTTETEISIIKTVIKKHNGELIHYTNIFEKANLNQVYYKLSNYELHRELEKLVDISFRATIGDY